MWAQKKSWKIPSLLPQEFMHLCIPSLKVLNISWTFQSSSMAPVCGEAWEVTSTKVVLYPSKHQILQCNGKFNYHQEILLQLLILSHFRVFISKCKLSLLKLSILHGFVELRDHHCKFLSSPKQFWTWLRRLPLSEPGYSDLLTWYISLINTWSLQININWMLLHWKPHQICILKMMGRAQSLPPAASASCSRLQGVLNLVNPHAVPEWGDLPAWVQKNHLCLSLHEFRLYVKIIFYSLHAPLLSLLQFYDIVFILCWYKHV